MCFDLIELLDLKVRVELGVVDVDVTLVDGDLSGGAARRRRVAGDIVSLELLGAPELYHLLVLLLLLLLLPSLESLVSQTDLWPPQKKVSGNIGDGSE